MINKLNNINFQTSYNINFKGNTPKEADSFEESLKRKYVSTGFLQGYNEIEGYVNNTYVNLKETEIIGLLPNSANYKGSLGDKPVDINIEDKNIKGKVGDKNILLEFDKNTYNEFYLRGKIDDMPIYIADGAMKDEANGEEDIITMLLSLMGYKVSIKDGRFTTLSMSEQSKKDKSSQNFSDWQIAQQNQMMSQTIAIKNQIADIFSEEQDTKQEDDLSDEEAPLLYDEILNI